MQSNRFVWAVGGGALGVIAAAAVVGAVLLAGSGDAPAEPPASLAATATAALEIDVEPVPTLEPVAPDAIVEETVRLHDQVAALNLSQQWLAGLLRSGDATTAQIDEAQRDVVARGIAAGLTADLLSDAVARQDGGAGASDMFAGIAKGAYVGAYAVAITAPGELTASGLDTVSRFVSAPVLEQPDAYAVPVDASEAPDAVVSLSAKRRTLMLEPLQDDFAAEMGHADRLLEASDPLSGATLAEMKAAVATRLAQHAELDAGVYEVSFPTQVLLSLADAAPEAGRVIYEALASSEFGTELYTFIRQETERQVEQRITETLVDALLDPGSGPDLDTLAGAISGAPAAEAPPFEEIFVEEILTLVPTFEVTSIEVTAGSQPAALITIAYEDVARPTRVGCATREIGGEEVPPGAGTVTVVIEDAFDLRRWPDTTFVDPVTFRCGSIYGVFAMGTIHPDKSGTAPAPTEDRGIDTPPGATIGDPVGAVDGTTLVVRVDWENPSDEELTLTCHFNGPAFTGQGGYNRETQTVGTGSGTATFTFDLGGPAEAGDYDFTCVLNDDISRSGRTAVAAEAWGIYDLVRIEEQRSSALGLIVAEASAVNEIALCSLDGGGLDCSITIGSMGGADLVLGPFPTRDEAVAAYCASLDPESVHGYWYPIGTFSFDGQEHPIPNGPAC